MGTDQGTARTAPSRHHSSATDWELIAVDARRTQTAWSTEDSVEELSQLARTAGAKVTGALVQKMDGVIVATARLAVSPDGKTLTTVTSSRTGNATTIYEKQ